MLTGKESKPNKQKRNFEEIEIMVNGMSSAAAAAAAAKSLQSCPTL